MNETLTTELVDAVNGRNASEKQAARAEYLRNLRLAKKQSDAQIEKLKAAMATLGYTAEDLAAHLRARREHSEFGRIIADGDAAYARIRELDTEIAGANSDFAKLKKSHDEKVFALSTEKNDLDTRCRLANEARAGRARVESEYREFLDDVPDPALASKRRHLFIAYRSQSDPHGEYEGISMQSIIADPSADPGKYEFITLPSQDAEELARWVEIWKAMRVGSIRYAAILCIGHAEVEELSNGQRVRAAARQVPTLCIAHDHAISLINQGHLDPVGVAWIRSPGVTKEAHAEMVEKINAAREKNKHRYGELPPGTVAVSTTTMTVSQ